MASVVDYSDPSLTFKKLAEQFGFHQVVADAIIAEGISDLTTFAYYFVSEADIGPQLMDGVKDLTR